MPRILGHYRVSINGFKCDRQTWDMAVPIAPEGHGDEIFLQIEYRTLNANGEMIGPQVSNTTLTIGSRGNGRYQYGSASADGGIATGDRFPTNQPSDRGGANLNTPDNVPPIKLWEGKLVSDWVNPGQAGSEFSNEMVVFITPTIWEWDDGAAAFDDWIDWQVEADAKFGKRAKEIVTGVYPFVGPIFDGVSLILETVSTIDKLKGRAGSRPIGMVEDGNQLSFLSQTLELSQARAYQICRENYGFGNGILPIRYKDSETFKGDYTLYLQVEALEVEHEVPPSQPPSSTSAAPSAGTITTPSVGTTVLGDPTTVRRGPGN